MHKWTNTQTHMCAITKIHKHENMSQSVTTVGSTVSTEDVEKNLFGQRCHSHRDKTLSQIKSNSLIFFLKGNVAYL